MLGASCPRCQEPVRIPEVPPQAMLRCPWCGEEFLARDLVDALPPMMELVSGGGLAEEAFQDVESYGFERTEDEIGFQTEGADTLAAPFYPSVRAMAESPGRRRQRGGNPIVGMLKVVLGGLAGVLLAGVILGFLGRAPDLGVWPFLGPDASPWPSGGGRRRAAAPAEPEPTRPPRERVFGGGDRKPASSPEVVSQGTFELSDPPRGPSEPSAAEEDRLLFSGAEEILGEYRRLRDENLRDDGEAEPWTEDDERDFARRLLEQLRKDAAVALEGPTFSAADAVILDDLVSGLGKEPQLVRAMAKEVSSTAEGAGDARGEEGVAAVLLGRIEERGGVRSLRLPGPEGKKILLDVESKIKVPREGATVLALGVWIEEESRQLLRLRYSRQLQGEEN